MNKFDGYTFTVYKHNLNDPNSLSGNWILTMLEDKSGTLWVGTDGGGMDKFGPENDPSIHFQHDPDDQLFSPTVFDDVAFGPLHMGLPENVFHQRVEEALEAVHIVDFGERLSHHLSVGQKKRISIATVLSMRPQILVLDEPSADLDPSARRSLINFLSQVPITMLVSTHDHRMVKELFPRMIIMDEGEIVADGPTLELLGDDDLLYAHGLEQP